MTGQPARESRGRLGNGECPEPVSAPSPRTWWTSALLSGSPAAPADPYAAGAGALCWSLAAEPGAVARARELCGGVLRRWEMADRAPDVELIVSELVTNALRHGRRNPPVTGAPDSDDPVQVSMLRRGAELVCAVRDRSDRMPERRDPDFRFESGRGLHLVASFCSGWGVLPVLPSGKHVWARFL
ncbi:ATP-binding protein [Streptomonospora algeriensis]|uniref:ATP-binding protein n=1 Tax=Streptomonospora algeriensis TaxID=995084 RepID=A0ABW3BB92_9ACTN